MYKFISLTVLVSLLAACPPVGGEVLEDPVATESTAVRADPAAESPSGHVMIVECSDDQQTWDTAVANFRVEQWTDRTIVTVDVTDARPDTLFTMWLRLRGTDPETGETFGGSPLTDKGSTPLAPTTALAALEAMTETTGATSAANVLTTDADGNASFTTELDFAMIGGEYPFDRFDDSYEPVGIVGAPLASFMIRLASHCQDGLAHGLLQGDREIWFNWSP